MAASWIPSRGSSIWDAVGTVIDENGEHEIAPQTAEEWDAVRNAAYDRRGIRQPADDAQPRQGRRRVDAGGASG